MERQVKESDFVLVISNEDYYNKINQLDGKTKGINWEVNIVYQLLYDDNCENNKFIPVTFNSTDSDFILSPLKPFTIYDVSGNDGFNRLLNRLHGISNTVKPPIGSYEPLEPKEAKTLFITSPIDLEKWNKARWRGNAYLWGEGMPPILGLVFDNYDVAKKIFEEWKLSAENDFADKFIRIDFIVPPFGEHIKNNKNCNNGLGYFVSVGANIDEATKRGNQSGIPLNEMLIMNINRIRWNDENVESWHRSKFQEIVRKGLGYLLVPVDAKRAISDSFYTPDLHLAIKMHHAHFITGEDALNNDMLSYIVKPDNPHFSL